MSKFRPNRQQMTEAIMLFRDDAVVTEMLYPEFEAVLDNVVSLPAWAGQQTHAAYVVISPMLQVHAVALFLLDFDENGTADSSWNVPLRQLVEKAEYGPDLGGGLIRLVCRSQSPVASLQASLWDPGENHLNEIRDAVQRNHLRLIAEEEDDSAVVAFELDKLQMVTEEAWQLPDAQERKQEREYQADVAENAQNTKTAQLIKQQNMRISTLESEHERALAALRQHAVKQQAGSQERIRQLAQDLQTAQESNRALQEQLQRQQQQHQTQLEKIRETSESATREYRAALQVSQGILQRLNAAGVSLVTVQPGIGHITIPAEEADEFLKNPPAYVAKYCMVSEEEYEVWLRHYEKPACDAHIAVTGELCGLPLERMTHPGRFTPGISNRCPRHRELL